MREYYIIKIPNDNLLHSLNVCIGAHADQRYSLDKKHLLVKTNVQLIAKEESKGVPRNSIFPPGLTTQVTYEYAYELMNTIEWNSTTTWEAI